MLYISLVVSAVMLVVVNVIVRRAEYPIPKAAGVCLVTPFLPTCLMMVLPAALYSALFAGVLLVVVFIPRRGKQMYLPLSFASAVIVYVVAGRPAAEQYRETVKLQQQYPFESLETRLPQRPRGEPKPPTDAKSFANFEHAVEHFERVEHAKRIAADPQAWNYTPTRTDTLRAIHDDAVSDFTNSPGFGVIRMGRTKPDLTTLAEPPRPAVPQPDYAAPFVHPPLELSKVLPTEDSPKLHELHAFGVLDFVNPKGFGYVKDRSRVAGFRSHGMSKVPAAGTWDVARIELVGLVVADKPRVYLSQHLPRMDELRGAATRDPDAFETAGLEELRKGDDLYARGTEKAARMVGAIRAAKQCTACHACERGELLGAFSYGLRR